MAIFTKKTWSDRISEYITRRTLTKEDGSTEIVTVERNEGDVSQEGDSFSADTMNDLETRIESGFNTLNSNKSEKSATVSNIYVGSDGKLHKVINGADSVIPFSSGGASGELTFSTANESITIKTGISNIKSFVLIGSSTGSYAHCVMWKSTNASKYFGARYATTIVGGSYNVGSTNSSAFSIMSVDTTTGDVVIKATASAAISSNYNPYTWLAC